jgi:hypothetical protein
MDGNKKGSINIILKPKQGLMGEVVVGGAYHQQWRANGEVSLLYNAEKFQMFANLGLETKPHSSKGSSEALRNDVQFNDSSFFKGKAFAPYIMIGGDYFINESSSIGILYNFDSEHQYDARQNDKYSIRSPSMLEDSIIYNENNSNHNGYWHSLTVNYDLTTDTLDSKFMTSVDWGGSFYNGKALNNYKFYTNQSQFDNAAYANVLNLGSEDGDNSNVFAYNAQFNKKFKNASTFTVGTKLSYTKYKSKGNYFSIINDTNVFDDDNSYTLDFNEYVGALFTGYKFSYKKSYFNISLRGEYNYNSYQNNNEDNKHSVNWAILPSFLHYITINNNHSVYYSYSQRVFRPAFVRYISNSAYDPISQSYGNPQLKQNQYFIFRTGYTFKQRYSVTLALNHANNLVLNIPELQDGKIIYRATNDGKSNYAGLGFNIPISIGDWWEMQNSISGGYNQYIYQTDSAKLSSQGFDCSISHSSYFYLPKGFTLELNYSYTSPSIALFTKYKDVHNLGIGIRYKINDYFRLSLSCSDILNSVQSASSYNYKDIITSENISKSLSSRMILFSFTYSFSAGKEVDYFEKTSGIETEYGRLSR